jgi:hypothetical protein
MCATIFLDDDAKLRRAGSVSMQCVVNIKDTTQIDAVAVVSKPPIRAGVITVSIADSKPVSSLDALSVTRHVDC